MKKQQKGRPILPRSEHRTNLVKVRFSDDELARLDELRSTETRARYLRQKAISEAGVNDIDPIATLQISRIGNNLNQIAKKLNEGGRITGNEALLKELKDLKEILEK
jgi:hypothetical protein